MYKSKSKSKRLPSDHDILLTPSCLLATISNSFSAHVQVNGKVFRIGHLGDMNECSMLGAIAGVEMVLKDVGMNITLGSGVGAAAAHFQKTSSVIRTREILGDHIYGVKK